MNLSDHTIANALIDVGLSSVDSFYPISTHVRDREDIYALRCKRSGVVVLSSINHVDDKTYEGREDLSYWGTGDRETLLATMRADDQRRAALLKPYATGKAYLDVGTGLGGILDLVKPFCAAAHAVELQIGARKVLETTGHTVYKDIYHVPKASYDVISLFHVYEHIPDQIAFLREAKTCLKPGGVIIIEVPNANDALLNQYNNQAFLNFTLWSQHLILHTPESLQRFITHAGFSTVNIQPVQRYPLANHLYWLTHGKPGGHVKWTAFQDAALNDAYSAVLARLQATDTLIAIAS